MAQQFYKVKYSIGQFYLILYNAIRTIGYVRRAKKAKLIDSKLIERIMLAVTEVNGCPLCAYGHTSMALETGMSEDEIQKLLSGDIQDIPINEVVAIIFAQHYAETKGNPSKASWVRLLETYEDLLAKGILGVTRMIMMGNVYGMALSALVSRFKGKPINYNYNQAEIKFTFLYEVILILSLIIFLPIALIHVFISSIYKKPVIVFKS